MADEHALRHYVPDAAARRVRNRDGTIDLAAPVPA